MRSEQAPYSPNIRTVIAPEQGSGVSADQPQPAPEATPSTKKKHRGILIGGIAAGSAVLLAGGLAFGLNAGGEQAGTHPVATASADPAKSDEAKTPETTTPKETLATGEALTQQFEIPAGLSPEVLGDTFVQRLSAWNMYGTVPSTQDQWNKGGTEGGDGYLKTLSEQGASAIADGLFVEGYQSDQSLTAYIASTAAFNQWITEGWVRTYNSAYPQLDKQPYSVTLTPDSVTVVDQGAPGTTLDIVTTQHVDLDNRYNPTSPSTLAQPGDATDGEQVETVVTFQTVGDTEQISSISAKNIS